MMRSYSAASASRSEVFRTTAGRARRSGGCSRSAAARPGRRARSASGASSVGEPLAVGLVLLVGRASGSPVVAEPLDDRRERIVGGRAAPRRWPAGPARRARVGPAAATATTSARRSSVGELGSVEPAGVDELAHAATDEPDVRRRASTRARQRARKPGRSALPTHVRCLVEPAVTHPPGPQPDRGSVLVDPQPNAEATPVLR